MASKKEFAEFVAEQLGDAGMITYRKMFGEYGLYCDGKYFAAVCDDRLFIKITEAGRKLCPDLQEAPPYDGAKNCFLIEDIDDKELLTRLTVATCAELPEPRKTHKK